MPPKCKPLATFSKETFFRIVTGIPKGERQNRDLITTEVVLRGNKPAPAGAVLNSQLDKEGNLWLVGSLEETDFSLPGQKALLVAKKKVISSLPDSSVFFNNARFLQQVRQNLIEKNIVFLVGIVDASKQMLKEFLEKLR